MLRKIGLFTAALMLLCSMPVIAQDIESIEFPELNKFEIPDVDIVTLDNGIRLYLLPDKSLPLFNVNVRINAGSYLEPADKVGLASILGTVMRTGGTEKWAGDDIDELLEGIGGTVETSMDDVSGGAFVNVLSEYQDLGLEVLSQILRHPRFDEDKIDLAMVQARTAISRRNDDVGAIALREYRKLIYGENSPYARTTEYATLENITRDDLVAFHHNWIRPQNLQIAVWGDFEKDALVAKIKGFFGDWERGIEEVPPPPDVDYQWRSKLYYAEKPDAKQTYIRMGHIGGLVTDPDYADRIVMNSVLGLGFGSRLTNEVRTRLGLAYSAGGRYVSNFSYPGYFFAVASTDPGNTVKASRAMMEQIASMHTKPPTDFEMKKGKDGYLNSFVFNFDTRREVVGRIMTYDFHGLPKDFLQKEKERVEQVTKDDVVTAARNNLRPEEMIVLVVGDSSNFDMPLDSLGMGEAVMIDITIPPPPSEEEEMLVVNEQNIAKGNEILSSAIKAHGGLDAFKNVETVTMKANMKLSMQGQEIALPMSSWQRFPDMDKNEVNFMGRRMVTIRKGESAWQTDMQTGELVEMSAAEMEESARDRARGTIRLFKAFDNPYYQPVFNGSNVINGVEVDWVALVGEDGDPIARIAISKADNMIVAKKYFGKSMQGEGTMLETYEEYTDVNGIKMPMVTTFEMNGQQVMEYQVQEMLVNEQLPTEIFDMPQ